MKQKSKNRVIDICRIVLGLTFIFSGFTKTIDPWGTALKITEYLNTFGFETLNSYRLGFSILFCSAELLLGLMLTFNVKIRLSSVFALLVMTFFLLLTFVTAAWIPIEDCGCFGDAIKLSPWGSFAKNVVLWGLALVVWLNARKRLKFFPITRRELVCTIFFAAIAAGLGIYCYNHLPLIDFLPYKKGVNLHEARYSTETTTEEIKLIYRDKKDGLQHEFSLQDTTWHDSERWEFVDHSETESLTSDATLREFAIFNSEGEFTEEIIGYEGRVYMISAIKLDKIKPRCGEKLAKIVKLGAEQSALVVCLTSSPISEGETIWFGGGAPIPVYNVDATTLITMLRATVGVVTLERGVIVEKKNCTDLQ